MDHRVCPVELAGMLDNGLRRILQNPYTLLKEYAKPGSVAIDMGCGPGYFTIPLSLLIGDSGRVYAVDVQQKMLDILSNKVERKKISNIIPTHVDQMNIDEKADLIWAFYMVHETGDIDAFFRRSAELLKEGGKLVIFEPSFHVSKEMFQHSLSAASEAGFIKINQPKRLFSRGAVFTLQNS